MIVFGQIYVFTYSFDRFNETTTFISNLNFCDSCNKLRLTCDGKLRPCLGSHLEFDLLKEIRRGATDENIENFIREVVARKPKAHEFRENYQPDRKMIAIGG